MSSGLIRYSLFKNRKNFNPLSLFKKNHNLTYEDFVSFLHSRNVETPGEDYFNRVKSAFDLEVKTEENHKVVEEVKETLLEEEKIKVDKEVSTEEVKKVKSKRRRRNEKPVDNKTDSDE